MFRLIRSSAVAGGAIWLAGCTQHAVDITVHNPGQYAYDIQVMNEGDPTSVVKLGILAPNQDVKKRVEVKDGTTLTVQALYPDSTRAWKNQRTVTSTDAKPLPLSLDVKPNGSDLPPFDPGVISDKLQHLGPGYGFDALQVKDALKTVFGGVCAISKAPTKPVEIHRCFNSDELKNATNYSDFDWPQASDSFTLEVTSETSVKLASSFAIYAGTASAAAGSVRKYETQLSGFGTVAKSGASPVLNKDQAKTLRAEVDAHPGAKILYINRMWVARQGYVRAYDGQKLTAEADAGMGAVLTANGAYTWSSTVASNRMFSEVAFEFWGEERQLPTTREPTAQTPEHVELIASSSPTLVNVTSQALKAVAPK